MVERSVDVLVAEAVDRVVAAANQESPELRMTADDKAWLAAAFMLSPFPALVEALSGLLAASKPYINDAAPGEDLNGLWAQRYSALSDARVDAFSALGGVRVSGRAERDRDYRMALSEMRAAEEELRLQGLDESAATLRSWLDRLAAVDGETTGGSDDE